MCGNKKFISDIQDILFNRRNNFIFPSIHVLLCLYNIINPIAPQK